MVVTLVLHLQLLQELFLLVRPAPGLRPGYPGPTHGPGPGSEGIRVRVQKRRKKRRILAKSWPKFVKFCYKKKEAAHQMYQEEHPEQHLNESLDAFIHVVQVEYSVDRSVVLH